MATSWSLDYCLACDRQTSGDAYCSQACRLADLESTSASSSSSSSSPASPTHPHSARASTASSGFFLPPAFDFAAHRTGPSSYGRKSGSPSSYSEQSYTPPASRPTCGHHHMSSSRSQRRSLPLPKALTPSSSETSLTSLQSSSSGQSSATEGISRQARNELREYTNSFDRVRDMKRRMTSN